MLGFYMQHLLVYPRVSRRKSNIRGSELDPGWVMTMTLSLWSRLVGRAVYFLRSVSKNIGQMIICAQRGTRGHTQAHRRLNIKRGLFVSHLLLITGLHKN